MHLFILTLKKALKQIVSIMRTYKLNRYLPLLIIFLLTGCGPSLKEFVSASSTGNALQAGPPDEFLTVTKKPLEMPPDFLLRPPSEDQIAFIDEQRNLSEEAIFGESEGTEISDGEVFILEMADADNANPQIKKELYSEEGAYANESLAEYVLRLKEENSQILDVEDEIRRLENDNIIKDEINMDKSDNKIKKDNVVVESLNMNQFTLQNLTEPGQSGNNKNINYDLRIEDIIDVGPIDNKLADGDPASDLKEDVKTEEIPPVDRMPTVFKGLLGGLSSGFGLF
tara:strand:+ start:569 stop:1420 length:852 start_codon:yes stop_codon:yes gene_type:complete